MRFSVTALTEETALNELELFNYFQGANGKISILDVIFAIILLVNDICVILSFIEFTKSCYRICQKKCFSLKQLSEIIVDMYALRYIYLM